MQRDIQIMMELLRCSAEGKKIDEKIISDITPGILYEIYSITSIHGLAHLVGNVIDELEIESDAPLIEKYRKQVPDAIFSYEKLNFETEQIGELFEKNCLPFILLKGSVLRKFYREPWLRTSCDVDILVLEKDLFRAGELLENELGYKKNREGTHHITYSLGSDVKIELHFSLIEKKQANKSSEITEKVWDYAKVEEGYKYRYILDDSFLYFYLIAHSATHFEAGGCGIKPVLDLYLLNKNINSQSQEIKKFLAKSGLSDFERYFKKLSEVWFEGKEHDEITRAMEDFIINGGLRGSKNQNLLFKKYHSKGKIGYIFSRIFISLDELKNEYPILKKAVFLFPVFEVLRCIKLLLKRDKSTMIKRYEIVKNISENDMKSYGEMFDKTGL